MLIVLICIVFLARTKQQRDSERFKRRLTEDIFKNLINETYELQEIKSSTKEEMPLDKKRGKRAKIQKLMLDKLKAAQENSIKDKDLRLLKRMITFAKKDTD